jgi:hypothetical protein
VTALSDNDEEKKPIEPDQGPPRRRLPLGGNYSYSPFWMYLVIAIILIIVIVGIIRR